MPPPPAAGCRERPPTSPPHWDQRGRPSVPYTFWPFLRGHTQTGTVAPAGRRLAPGPLAEKLRDRVGRSGPARRQSPGEPALAKRITATPRTTLFTSPQQAPEPGSRWAAVDQRPTRTSRADQDACFLTQTPSGGLSSFSGVVRKWPGDSFLSLSGREGHVLTAKSLLPTTGASGQLTWPRQAVGQKGTAQLAAGEAALAGPGACRLACLPLALCGASDSQGRPNGSR
jgi:hypothetical protein